MHLYLWRNKEAGRSYSWIICTSQQSSYKTSNTLNQIRVGCETQNFRSYKNRHWNSMIQEKTLISDTFRIWQLLDESFFFPQVLHLLNRHKNRLFKFVTEHIINICSSPISTTFSIQTHKRVRIFRQLCKLFFKELMILKLCSLKAETLRSDSHKQVKSLL